MTRKLGKINSAAPLYFSQVHFDKKFWSEFLLYSEESLPNPNGCVHAYYTLMYKAVTQRYGGIILGELAIAKAMTVMDLGLNANKNGAVSRIVERTVIYPRMFSNHSYSDTSKNPETSTVRIIKE